jgi:hypothetical protein
MLRIPHCLDNRLINGGKVVSLTHPPHFTPKKHYYFNVSATQTESNSVEILETLAMIRQVFGEERMSVYGSLNGMLGSGQTEKCETDEEQSQEHAYYFH